MKNEINYELILINENLKIIMNVLIIKSLIK